MAIGFELPGRFQHRVGLADTGGVAEKNRQAAPSLFVGFRLGESQHGLRRGTWLFNARMHHWRLFGRFGDIGQHRFLQGGQRIGTGGHQQSLPAHGKLQ